MSQILFLDPPVNISNLILKKKIFVKNGFFWKILAFFGIFWSKIGVPRTKTTSSSSKFCADSKTARLFGPRTVTLLENRVFVSQGGTKIQFLKNKKFSFLRAFSKLIFDPNRPKITQNSFLDMVVNILKIILTKKNSVKSRLFWSKSDFFWKKSGQNWIFFQIIAQNWVKESAAQVKTNFIFCEILSGFQKCPTFCLYGRHSTRKSQFCEARHTGARTGILP